MRLKDIVYGKQEKIGFLDIETSNLSADFGFIFSYCILDDETDKIDEYILTPEDIKRGRFDKLLIKKMVKDLVKYDRVVTYYGTKFDLPFVRTRALHHNIPFPHYKSGINHSDCYYMARNRLKLSRNRLENVAVFFKIPAKQHKMEPEQWQLANSGNEKALRYILKHNREDVKTTKAVYHLLKNYVMKNKKSI